jgi:hypothetical protein
VFVRRVLPLSRVHVCEYNWGGDDAHLSPPLDVLIVSDCLLPKLYPIEPLVAALDKLAGPNTAIIVSYEHRCVVEGGGLGLGGRSRDECDSRRHILASGGMSSDSSTTPIS